MVKKSTMKKQENVLRAASGAVFQHISSRTGRMAGLLSLVTVFVLLGMGSAWAQTDPCTKTYSVCSGESVVLSHDPSCGNGGHYVWAAFQDDGNRFNAGVYSPPTYTHSDDCLVGGGWYKGENVGGCSTCGPGQENYCHYPGALTIDIKNGIDPWIEFPISIPGGADPAIYKYFVLRYKINTLPANTTNAQRTMVIYFRKAGQTGFTQTQIYSYVIPETAAWGTTHKCATTNDYSLIVLDLSTLGNTWLAGGNITAIRFDPMQYPTTKTNSIHMSVDYIGLVANAPASVGHHDHGGTYSFGSNTNFTLTNVTTNTTVYSNQINNDGQVPFSGNPEGVAKYGWTASQSTHNVTVVPALNAGAIGSGSDKICYGDVAALPTIGNATQASQSAPGATFTYQWYVSKDGGALTLASGTPSGNPSGIEFKPADSYASTPGAYVFTRQVTSSLCSASPKTSEGSYTLKVLPQFSAGSIGTNSGTACANTFVICNEYTTSTARWRSARTTGKRSNARFPTRN